MRRNYASLGVEEKEVSFGRRWRVTGMDENLRKGIKEGGRASFR